MLRQVLGAGQHGSPDAGQGLRIGVTACLGGEGVTTVASQFAWAAATSLEGSVLLVDCNAKRGRIEQVFGLGEQAGLADVLQSKGDPDQFMVAGPLPGLRLLGAGSAELRGQLYDDPQALHEMLTRLTGLYRLVICDLPPLEETGVMLELVRQVDGLLLVVEAERTSQDVVLAAQRLVTRHEGRLLGVVLNKLRQPATSRWNRR